MTAGERFRQWIDETASGWADRLATWTLGVIGRGITKSMEDREPEIIELTKEILTDIKANPAIPESYKRIIDKSLVTGNIGDVIVGWIFTVLGTVMSILSWGAVPAKVVGYTQERVSKTYRLDPISVITAWRRDPTKYEAYFDDLRDQGWDDDRIEALKFFTLYYPPPADLVRWQAREVFEPEMIAKYGLDDELGGIERAPFYKAGMNDEQIVNYWRAHWEHASWNQIIEMRRRELITDQDIWDWFRLVEIVPFWRDNLIKTLWEIPTRVDVRRFWDMGTINEARLREIYGSLGYHDKDLDDYVLWTKVYVAFPDLITRFKNGWLTVDDVKSELIGLGMADDRAEELIQTKVKAAASEKLAKDKDLTMSQIVKGVKKAVITRDEGSILLQDMGYDEGEALFILAIEIPQDEVVTEVKQRELTKTDIVNGLKAGILTEEEALAKLQELRYTLDDSQFLLDIYKATITPPTETREKEASKADIVKAVKNGLITAEDGYLMLQDIGYSPESSEFILMVQAETSPFSPQSYSEFKDLTNKWRNIVSPPGKVEPEELQKAGQELIERQQDVEALKELIKQEKAQLIDVEVIPEETTARLTDLQTKLHRAQSALQLALTNYNALRAEWRQS